MDWADINVWSDFSGIEWLVDEIKKSLFFDLKQANNHPRYYGCLRNDDFGFSMFFDVKPGLNNPPLNILMTGKFFRLDWSYDFLNDFLLLINEAKEFGFKWRPVRFDASIDFVTWGSEPFYPDPESLQTTAGKKEIDRTYGDDGSLKKISSGYGSDCALKVYDKLKDTEDKNYLNRHPDFEGCSGVYRLEFQLRGETLRAIFKNSFESFSDYMTTFKEVLGQCFRRYKFSNFEFPSSSVSSYVRRVSTDQASLNYWHDQLLKAARMVNYYEHLLYGGKHTLKTFGQIQAEERIIDLMSEAEKIGF